MADHVNPPSLEQTLEDGFYPHKCIEPGCEHVVQFDDEPWCFTHEPDEGAWVSKPGYSARAEGLPREEW